MDRIRDEDILKQCFTVRLADKKHLIGGWVITIVIPWLLPVMFSL